MIHAFRPPDQRVFFPLEPFFRLHKSLEEYVAFLSWDLAFFLKSAQGRRELVRIGLATKEKLHFPTLDQLLAVKRLENYLALFWFAWMSCHWHPLSFPGHMIRWETMWNRKKWGRSWNSWIKPSTPWRKLLRSCVIVQTRRISELWLELLEKCCLIMQQEISYLNSLSWFRVVWTKHYKASLEEKSLIPRVASFVENRKKNARPTSVLEVDEVDEDADLAVDDRFPELAGNLAAEDVSSVPERSREFEEKHSSCDDPDVHLLHRDWCLFDIILLSVTNSFQCYEL